MIKSNLAIKMAEKKIRTVKELSEKTGIARKSLTALYYDNGKGIQFQTLNTLCIFFDVGLQEILVYETEAS